MAAAAPQVPAAEFRCPHGWQKQCFFPYPADASWNAAASRAEVPDGTGTTTYPGAGSAPRIRATIGAGTGDGDCTDSPAIGLLRGRVQGPRRAAHLGVTMAANHDAAAAERVEAVLAQVAARGVRELGEGQVHQSNGAPRRQVETAEDLQQRGLAGARRAHDRQRLAALDDEVHVLQHLEAVARFDEVLAHVLAGKCRWFSHAAGPLPVGCAPPATRGTASRRSTARMQ